MEWTLLGSLGADERRAVLDRTHRRHFRRRDTVFHEGDPGDSYHFITRGKVAVQVATPNGDFATLNVLNRGDGFGELALVGAEVRRSATVCALDTTETLVLHRRDFDDVCRRHPGVQRLLVELLAQQVRRLSNQVLDALYVPAEHRVVRRLHELATTSGDADGKVVIPVTQEELASMAGTTRPTANRALQTLVGAGVAILGRGRTEILDIEALAGRAG